MTKRVVWNCAGCNGIHQIEFSPIPTTKNGWQELGRCSYSGTLIAAKPKKTKLRRWFDRTFHLEEINGHEACPTYMYRWCFYRWGTVRIYLHHFVGDDWSRDFHDHPKRFISIGLKGRYVEQTPIFDPGMGPIDMVTFDRAANEELFVAPWIRTFPAEHRHRIVLDEPVNDPPDCWTLVFTFPATREWGFWPGNRWVQWEQYVNDKGLVGAGKNCD